MRFTRHPNGFAKTQETAQTANDSFSFRPTRTSSHG